MTKLNLQFFFTLSNLLAMTNFRKHIDRKSSTMLYQSCDNVEDISYRTENMLSVSTVREIWYIFRREISFIEIFQP